MNTFFFFIISPAEKTLNTKNDIHTALSLHLKKK